MIRSLPKQTLPITKTTQANFVSKTASVLILTLFMTATCLAERSEHPTFQAARSAAKPKGHDVIVFVHGSDWNPYGEQIRTTAWENPSFQSSVAKLAQLSRIDVQENPSEAQKKNLIQRTKGFPIKQFNNYPAIYFIDPDGTYYASLSGDTLPSDPIEFRQAIAKVLQKRRKRDEYISQAATETDLSQKTKLLYLGYQLGFGKGKFIRQAIRQADPNDTQGYLAILNFNGQALVIKARNLTKDGKPQQAIAMLDKQLANPHLLPIQRQWVLLAKINTYRHIPNSKPKMREIAAESKKISATSIPGRAVVVIANRFAKLPQKK